VENRCIEIAAVEKQKYRVAAVKKPIYRNSHCGKHRKED
jgi:hypothetical protein